MQNAGIAALGLDWRYLAFDVDPEHLDDAIRGAARMGFIGLNLTVPHKQIAVDMVDVLHPTGKEWGAVNTIRFEGRESDNAAWRSLSDFPQNPPQIRSVGYNTDADAIIHALTRDLKIDLKGATVWVVGLGGAGRTVALRLAKEPVGSLWLYNRTAERAEAAAKEITSRHPDRQVRTGIPEGPIAVNLIINATSLGLHSDDPCPIDIQSGVLERARAAYDLIYQPAETQFLKAAAAAGCRTENGLGMLLYQGTRALEIWADRSAPVDAMKQALHDHMAGTARPAAASPAEVRP